MSVVVLAAVLGVAALLFVLGRRSDESVRMPGGGGASEALTVEAALAAGRKIEAVKLYREQHGVDLREAKEAVERLQRSAPGA
jgi:ribosomal protein L7/L12